MFRLSLMFVALMVFALAAQGCRSACGCQTQAGLAPEVRLAPTTEPAAPPAVARAWSASAATYPSGGAVAFANYRYEFGDSADPEWQNTLIDLAEFAAGVFAFPINAILCPPWRPINYRGEYQ